MSGIDSAATLGAGLQEHGPTSFLRTGSEGRSEAGGGHRHHRPRLDGCATRVVELPAKVGAAGAVLRGERRER